MMAREWSVLHGACGRQRLRSESPLAETVAEGRLAHCKVPGAAFLEPRTAR